MVNRRRAIGPAGAVARMVAGGALIGLVLWSPDWWDSDLVWYDFALGLGAFPAALVAGQLLRLRFTTARLEATDNLTTCLNIAAGAVLFIIDYTQDAAALFYGASMLLAAVRDYAGCEVLAISNWLLRRDDQVGCIFFSPIDEVEARLGGASRAS